MKRVLLTSIAAALFAAACSHQPVQKSAALPEGVRFVEAVNATEDGITIPYKKYQLSNGLTVLIHEDHSDPLVHVDVTYHVGSAREDIGKSGFAHFFEHMMFQGSEHVADEEHFKIITEAGGTLNGTTNTDRTNYFQTVPANQLETMLWLEADRMGFLLDAVTQQKFEVQRETVKNERGQRYDNAPYGLLRERVAEALYPEGHPYSWQTIGYIDDLNRVNVNDLKAFFLRWYGPNNAVLTIGGDVDVAQTLKWVDKYFGSIPVGPAVTDMEKMPAKLDNDRYISMEDNVHLPLLYINFPTVYAFHEDEAALDILAEIMGQGKTSLLYQNLVKNQIAVQASASHPCAELACNFTMLALPNPALMQGKTLADLEAVIRKTLVEFEQRGVQDDDLIKAKAKLEASKIFGLESVSGKVSQLAYFETFLEDANYVGKDLKRYQNVTKADVMRVYEQYIKGQKAVIMSIVPKGAKQLIAHEDTYTAKPRTLPDYAPIGDTDLAYRRAQDNFDRSAKPQPGQAPGVNLPKTWTEKLANGIEVLGAEYNETPTVSLSVELNIGHRHVPVEKAGLAQLTAAMMNETTKNYSNEQFALELEKLGSSISFSAGDNYSSLNVSSLSKNLEKTLQLAVERLVNPAFTESDFARVKAQAIQGIEHSKKQPTVTANNAFSKLLFGATHPLGQPSSGTVESVKALTLDEVKAFYAQYFSPSVASIVVVGDVPKAKLLKQLNVFAEWPAQNVAQPNLPNANSLGKTRIYLIDKPGAAQSEIRIGNHALPYDATGEYYRAGLMNFNLGGAFNSRINLNLREDKGYTYGARSGFSGAEDYGYFSAGAGVRTDATDKSIVEFLKEIRSYREQGMTEAELQFLKNAIGQRDARAYETPSQKLNFLFQMMRYDLKPDFVDQQQKILREISLEELNQLANKLLDVEQMQIVVVGDAKAVLPGLEALGYEIVRMDAEGNVL